jgi:dihydroorotase
MFMGSSTGSLLVADDAGVAEVLMRGSRRIAVHAEDETRLRARFAIVRGGADPTLHPEWRDAEAAYAATRRLLALATETKRRVHVLHVSTAEEMAFLAEHKDWASVEATPHHLTLEAPEAYERLGTYAQMNPPVRDARHRRALWAALAAGVVDVLGSDHAPHARAEKDHAYPDSHSGMTGVQTLVPVMLNHVNAGELTLERFVDLTSHGPQRLFGIRGKGRIAVGYDADLTVVDLKRRQTIANSWIASRCAWTPYDGMTAQGWPVGTFVRGRRVMWDGEIAAPAQGEPVRFFG